MEKKGIKLYFPILFFISSFSPLFAQQDITFAKNIAPVIFQKCTPCHHAGQIGPMPLTTYEEVASYATMIGYVTQIGYMPPWRAHSAAQSLKGENKLSTTELQLLQEWITKGFPEGDAKTTPPLPHFHDSDKMKMPDLVISMSEAFEQYGVYYDQYRVFNLPTGLKEDKIVEAIEFVPGKSSIVRGAIISVDTGNGIDVLDEWDPQYGYFSFGELGFVPEESRWYSWQPGKEMTSFPQGQGLHLPKGAKLILHIHYGPTGIPEKDSSHINLKFSEQEKSQQIFSAPLVHSYNMTNDSFFIPKEKITRYHASFRVPFDIAIHGIFPHSHLLGKNWEIFTVTPDRKNSQSLLKIEDWDFNWKQHYEFEAPLIIRQGTEVHALAAYDNSKENLLNPSDPPRAMAWGKRMFEEMFLVFFSMSEHIDSDAPKKTFRLLPGAINATPSRGLIFQFHTKKKGKFSCQLKDFSGVVQKNIFEKKVFSKGQFTQKVNLQLLKKGNYYLELQSKNQIERKIFVLLGEEVFD